MLPRFCQIRQKWGFISSFIIQNFRKITYYFCVRIKFYKQKNMRNFILSVSVILAMQAAAQTGGTVTGILKEKASGLPMEFATVGLHEAETKNVKNGCMTDSTGQFRFTFRMSPLACATA